MARNDQDRGFATTRWSLIARMKEGGDDARLALDELARIYRPAVRAFLQYRGLSLEEAEDATQEFFAAVVLSRNWFTKVQPDPGRRLRTLMCIALKRFHIDRYRRSKSRGRDRVTIRSLADEDPTSGSGSATNLEVHFDRHWALAQLEEALRRCEANFRGKGKAGHWNVFQARLINPAVAQMIAPPMADIALEYGFASDAAAAAAVQTVRRRFQSLLREVVAETAESPEAADEEYNYLMAILSGA